MAIETNVPFPKRILQSTHDIYKKNPQAFMFMSAAAIVVITSIIAAIVVGVTLEVQPSNEVKQKLQDLQNKVDQQVRKANRRKAAQRRHDLELERLKNELAQTGPEITDTSTTITSTNTNNIPNGGETEAARLAREEKEKREEEEKAKKKKEEDELDELDKNPKKTFTWKPLPEVIYIDGATSDIGLYKLKNDKGEDEGLLSEKLESNHEELKNTVKMATNTSNNLPYLLVTTAPDKKLLANEKVKPLLPETIPDLSFPYYQRPEVGLNLSYLQTLTFGRKPPETSEIMRYISFAYPISEYSSTHQKFFSTYNSDLLKSLGPEEILRIGKEFIFSIYKLFQLKQVFIPTNDMIVLYNENHPCIFLGPLEIFDEKSQAFSTSYNNFLKLLENVPNLTEEVKAFVKKGTLPFNINEIKKLPNFSKVFLEYEPKLIEYIKTKGIVEAKEVIEFEPSKESIVYNPASKNKVIKFGAIDYLEVKEKMDKKFVITDRIDFETLDGSANDKELKEHQTEISKVIHGVKLNYTDTTLATTCKTYVMPILYHKISSQLYKLPPGGDNHKMYRNEALITAEIKSGFAIDKVDYEVHNIKNDVPEKDVKIILQSVFAKANQLYTKKDHPSMYSWTWRLYIPKPLDGANDLQLIIPLKSAHKKDFKAIVEQPWKLWMNDVVKTVCQHHPAYMQSVQKKLDEAFDKVYDPTSPELAPLFA